MTQVPQTARRGLRKTSKQGGSIAPNGHPHGKSNGWRTARRVRVAIQKCGCDEYNFFVAAFFYAAYTQKGNAPEKFYPVQEVDWFKALELGDLPKLPPEGYRIPDCVRLLTEKVLGEVIPNHRYPESFFRGVQEYRKRALALISLAM